MNIQKLRLFTLEIFLILFLFFILFASMIDNRLLLTIFIVIFTIVSAVLLKIKRHKSIFNRQVTILMLVFAGIYLAVLYFLGIFYGFERSKYIFSLDNIFKVILPIAIIIICSELIRYILLSVDGKVRIFRKKINISSFLTLIAMILLDVIVNIGVYDLTKIEDFLMFLGYTAFASVACNLLYNYLAQKYSPLGTIFFRIITILYSYIVPIIPSIYIFLQTFIRIIYPFIIYILMDRIYNKKFAAEYVNERRDRFWTAVLVILSISLIMLISCQFRYGIIVIGSGSMAQTINKGDAIIFEQYKGQPILNGQVIIFKKDDIRTVHRVVDIRKTNGEIRYYTKGDANSLMDEDYRTSSDIVGLVKIRIRYIGLPTLYFRDLFK